LGLLLFDGFDILGSNLAFHINYDLSIHAFNSSNQPGDWSLPLNTPLTIKKFVKCSVFIGKIDMNLSQLRDVMFNVVGLPCSFHFDVSFSLKAE